MGEVSRPESHNRVFLEALKGLSAEGMYSRLEEKDKITLLTAPVARLAGGAPLLTL